MKRVQMRLHYGWIVALVTFVILLVTAGVRATPGVLMISLEDEFGWSRTVISAAVAINIALFGRRPVGRNAGVGVFTDKIVKHVGGDPSVYTAIGVG